MSRRVVMIGGIAAIMAGIGLSQADRLAAQWMAVAAPTALLDGCTDVPEAVALAETLRLRGIAVDRALADLDRRKQDIATAEQQLKTRLEALKAAKSALGDARSKHSDATTAGIDRLIAVYDAMKPAEAATILAALPPEFAAEILTRVQPDAGARIIAAIEPGQAAILTTYMGARRLTGD